MCLNEHGVRRYVERIQKNRPYKVVQPVTLSQKTPGLTDKKTHAAQLRKDKMARCTRAIKLMTLQSCAKPWCLVLN